MANDTRYLTADNLALRPHAAYDTLTVDLFDQPYGTEHKDTAIGCLVGQDNGEYVPYVWDTVGGTRVSGKASLNDAIRAMCQYLNPYTFVN
jgi:hypothetical protein